MHNRLHHKKLAHAGKVGMAAEGTYHMCEIAGAHSGVLIAAGVLLLMLVVRACTGVPLD